MYDYNTVKSKKKKNAQYKVQQAQIEYFSLLNTICLYVLNGDITPNNFCIQYKPTLWKLMELFPDYFKIGKTYENVGKLVKKYKDNLLKLD